MATILVVDDDPVTRIFLEALLCQEGYRVVMASDGVQALSCLETEGCDLVLMDIQMPHLDGYQATRQIKTRLRREWFLPVIFLTSVQTDVELAHCLECGGDDFLTKPPSPVILRARIQAWLQRAELANRMASDRQQMENVILKMRHYDQFDPKGLRVLMTPMEKTDGDIVLSACRSDGVQHLLVGDFTGHGLSASICGPLVADIFYRMTAQNQPLQEIVDQIHATIFHRLPVNMFLAAAFLELDRGRESLRIWNAGLPEVVVLGEGKVLGRFSSRLPPLGIAAQLQAEHAVAAFPFSRHDTVFLFTDGSVETCSPNGELFGEERLLDFLKALPFFAIGLETLLTVLGQFRGGMEQKDDITVVAVAWE
jgi:DNA-binding response OmpR family regulator